ncbi:MAG: HDOD domain-containing protein, partial [Myxococcota bacterium]|nr:HDOD domain-containing protein [Myxococcota bacterium]
MTEKLDQARIAEMVEQMPAFPRSVQQVLNLTSDINAPPKELIRVIEHDPVLTGRILKVVNSAYFGLSRRILSIKHAVVIAGLNTVKHVALSVAALGALPEVDNDGLDMDEYLEHSLATGAVARFIARKVGVPARECEDFFLTGLIHDIGQVVFAIAIPGQFASIVDTSFKRNIPLCQVEARLLGTHHAHIGALVAQKWELPETLCRSIALHHHTGAKARHDRAS